MSDILSQIAANRLMPVIALDDTDDAAPLGDALIAGGLPVAEITFRTAAAEASIRTMSKMPGMLVGAGTVLDVDTVKRAVDAGAKFMVSPGFSSKVVSYCVDNNIPITPGTVTPTDIQAAIEHGITTVKFFPAETFGGIKAIKTLAAPFGQIRFIPTGGITEKQLLDYLGFKPVLAVGGSWFVTKDLISAKKFDEITRLTSQAVKVAKEARP
ncbi:MAG TPA: bifunctional 4-hydroxy-2-oxoglutarate aldolase/2-dehydro-3-deoxy-phosphogluconate aldolase [Tepidisphaeraceae bacterium]|nr:bifunctional 4-hydroxy-2-oxoglutarate aldolase/2-dehydro-3-deoxy-phosphogluconate aldolase [Tepidisphaeraceae bacterium]